MLQRVRNCRIYYYYYYIIIVIFKIATLVHHILSRCPSYLADLVVFNTADSQQCQLRGVNQ